MESPSGEWQVMHHAWIPGTWQWFTPPLAALDCLDERFSRPASKALAPTGIVRHIRDTALTHDRRHERSESLLREKAFA